jgi:hypothetical protein
MPETEVRRRSGYMNAEECGSNGAEAEMTILFME